MEGASRAPDILIMSLATPLEEPGAVTAGKAVPQGVCCTKSPSEEPQQSNFFLLSSCTAHPWKAMCKDVLQPSQIIQSYFYLSPL